MALQVSRIIFLLLLAPVMAYSQESLVFPDSSPLNLTYSPNYVKQLTVLLQNNGSHPVSVEFVVTLLPVNGLDKFDVSLPGQDGQIKPGQIKAFYLNIITTDKKAQSNNTNLSQTGFLVASATGNGSIKPAVRPVNFYVERPALIGHRRFSLPVGLSAIVVAIVMLRLWIDKGLSPAAKMREVKFDPKESWLSNFVVGASILNGALGLGTRKEDAQIEITLLAGIFGLLIVIGPIVYNLTLSRGEAGANRGRIVWFLLACTITLVGGFGSLATAWIVFNRFAETRLISQFINWVFLATIAILGTLIIFYVNKSILQTVVTQASEAKVKDKKALPERAALL